MLYNMRVDYRRFDIQGDRAENSIYRRLRFSESPNFWGRDKYSRYFDDWRLFQ